MENLAMQLDNALDILTTKVNNHISEDYKLFKTEFFEFKKKIFGNGEKGYVDKRIEENTVELEERLIKVITDSIDKAFSTREIATREKWGIRTWGLAITLGMFFLDKGWDIAQKVMAVIK
jgi:hypothetical protein